MQLMRPIGSMTVAAAMTIVLAIAVTVAVAVAVAVAITFSIHSPRYTCTSDHTHSTHQRINPSKPHLTPPHQYPIKPPSPTLQVLQQRLRTPQHRPGSALGNHPRRPSRRTPHPHTAPPRRPQRPFRGRATHGADGANGVTAAVPLLRARPWFFRNHRERINRVY